MPRFAIPFLSALTCWTLGSLWAETVEFLPVADTSLLAVTPGNNLGAAERLAVGGTAKKLPARGLFRFDPTSKLPAGATIVGASLLFRVVKEPEPSVASPFKVHRLLVEWTEGLGKGDAGEPARPEESTWNHRVHPTTAWSTPGGAPGIEFAAVASAEIGMAGLGSYAMAGEGLRSDVEGWLRDPTTNFGWILMSADETTALTSRRVASREDLANAPRLVVDYVMVSPPVWRRWERVGDRFELEFLGEAGNVYQVESREDFGGARPWQVITNIVVKQVTTPVVIIEPIDRFDSRVYRVGDVGDVD